MVKANTSKAESKAFDPDNKENRIQRMVNDGMKAEMDAGGLDMVCSVLRDGDGKEISTQDLIEIENKLVLRWRLKEKISEKEIKARLQIFRKSVGLPFETGAEKRTRIITQDIRNWIEISEGEFYTRDIFDELNISREHKAQVSKILTRLSKEGLIERAGRRTGCFRRIERDLVKMDIFSTPQETLNITLPFGIDEIVKTREGEVIVVAGAKNSGKTAFSLWTAIENRDWFEVHYFNSEMGEDELKERCENFTDIPFQEWRKISFYPRSDNFQDVIVPGTGKLNIIDFMEVYEDFWITKKWIAQIWKKLDGALAIVNLQKPHNRDFGWGGEGTIEKARLALSIDKGTLKIVSAKSWKTRENPNGKKITFKLVGGSKFIPIDDWTLAED